MKQDDEGLPVAEICRKADIRWLASECTFAEKQLGGILQLEEEIRWLAAG